MCVRARARAVICMWKKENNLEESALSPYHVGCRDWMLGVLLISTFTEESSQGRIPLQKEYVLQILQITNFKKVLFQLKIGEVSVHDWLVQLFSSCGKIAHHDERMWQSKVSHLMTHTKEREDLGLTISFKGIPQWFHDPLQIGTCFGEILAPSNNTPCRPLEDVLGPQYRK